MAERQEQLQGDQGAVRAFLSALRGQAGSLIKAKEHTRRVQLFVGKNTASPSGGHFGALTIDASRLNQKECELAKARLQIRGRIPHHVIGISGTYYMTPSQWDAFIRAGGKITE